jgi:hypothetical protein
LFIFNGNFILRFKLNHFNRVLASFELDRISWLG